MAANTYDYIIVGARFGGLSWPIDRRRPPQSPAVEAGPSGHPLSQVPISYGQLIQDPAANWCYGSEPEAGAAHRRIPVPRGRLLGGSSAINGLVYVRGQPRLRHLGAIGQWAGRGTICSRFSAKSKTTRAAATTSAEGGLLHVECPDESPLYDVLLAAGRQGLAPNADYNGASQEGIVKAEHRDGRRMSVAYCYLKPAKARANLHIVTGAGHRPDLRRQALHRRALPRRLAQRRRRPYSARAGEVILAGGSINSPQLLQLSGVGQPRVWPSMASRCPRTAGRR